MLCKPLNTHSLILPNFKLKKLTECILMQIRREQTRKRPLTLTDIYPTEHTRCSFIHIIIIIIIIIIVVVIVVIVVVVVVVVITCDYRLLVAHTYMLSTCTYMLLACTYMLLTHTYMLNNMYVSVISYLQTHDLYIYFYLYSQVHVQV